MLFLSRKLILVSAALVVLGTKAYNANYKSSKVWETTKADKSLWSLNKGNFILNFVSNCTAYKDWFESF
jgi:hypothetical protein